MNRVALCDRSQEGAEQRSQRGRRRRERRRRPCCVSWRGVRRRECGGGGGGSSYSPYRPETAADAWPSSSVEEALDGYEPISRACILLRGLEALPIKQLRLIGHDLQKLADAAAASWIPGSQGSMGDGGPEVGGEVLEGGWGEAAQ